MTKPQISHSQLVLFLTPGAEGTWYFGVLIFKQLIKPLRSAHLQLGVTVVDAPARQRTSPSGQRCSLLSPLSVLEAPNPGCPLEAQGEGRSMRRPTVDEVDKGLWGWDREQVVSKSSQGSPIAIRAGNHSLKA